MNEKLVPTKTSKFNTGTALTEHSNLSNLKE